MATFHQGNLRKALGWNFRLDVKDNAAGPTKVVRESV